MLTRASDIRRIAGILREKLRRNDPTSIRALDTCSISSPVAPL